MDVTERLPVDLRDYSTTMPTRFLLFTLLPTMFGAAHHVDHVIRGNHVGWPVTAEVTHFTYSLAIYPLLVVSLYLTVQDRVGAKYWTGFFVVSTAMVAVPHIGPFAVEPPADIISPYANVAIGYLAFGLLLTLLASVVAGAIYAAILWLRRWSDPQTTE